MDEETLKSIAGQLRKPHGENASQVGKKMNEGNRLINLYTIEALDLKPFDHVLEIGMGNGAYVKNILSAYDSIRYAGCDFSEAMIAEARANNDDFIKEGRAMFYLASADNLPFDKAAFTKVFAINTIYFWESPEIELKEIRRVLKPGGQIFIAIRPKAIMEGYPFTKYGFRMYAKEDLSALLAANNFIVKDIIERIEPDQDVQGQTVKVETLIISASKPA